MQLADDVTLNLASDEEPDVSRLSQALTHPSHEVWTGITVGDTDPVEHLDLWLATTTHHFGRLSVGAQAHQRGLVPPAMRWSGATLHNGSSTLAYLALRSAGDQSEELGVIAYGTEAATFAAHTVELLHRWNKQRPTQPAITAHPADTPTEKLPEGTRIHKPDTTLTVAW
ncbi:hypothetical protein [Streptomyces typhae]|uniref:hypothetical protein n=1 Tax=Streptomyces typhae TaxID=2681492 RepID=UPI0018DEF57D|nr:hypothetical protein [Streptomyces typhae]